MKRAKKLAFIGEPKFADGMQVWYGPVLFHASLRQGESSMIRLSVQPHVQPRIRLQRRVLDVRYTYRTDMSTAGTSVQLTGRKGSRSRSFSTTARHYLYLRLIPTTNVTTVRTTPILLLTTLSSHYICTPEYVPPPKAPSETAQTY